MKNRKLGSTLARDGASHGPAKVSGANLGSFSGRTNALVQHFGSVAEVARRSGSSETAVRKWIDGAEPSVERCLALAKGTGVSLAWLLGGVPPMWESEMTEAERDTQMIVLGDPDDEAVKAAYRRRDAALKGFVAGLATAQEPQERASQAVRREDLKIALQLASEALGNRELPPDKHAELVTLIYELLEEGLPEAKVLRFARAAAA
ncbi:helix-turn-helix domain-containing protein [Dyella lutea]|uniref:Helix-turn-helix domain-containing protein n=1 Tax=Dyella lutea TaxID=2950441 RepID=A0ABT1FE10_9GAMM|nr:helix-turn-helix transcriptional regulator [Dyella lutea]MCP1375350.1 helix-turn-helix domain-containing protein [Dyella lutea]